jgi:hypothetical protein
MRNITDNGHLTSPTRLSHVRRNRQKLRRKRKSTAALLVCNPVRNRPNTPPGAAEQNGRKHSASSSRLPEQDWLIEHQDKYAGEWVALEGRRLVSHGPSARKVLEAAKAEGYKLPLVVHIPSEPQLPFGGW